MEQTILLKGLALFATLTGLQQWLAQTVALFDIMFILLITAFLLSLEMDYAKHKRREGDNQQPSQDPSQKPFLGQSVNLA